MNLIAPKSAQGEFHGHYPVQIQYIQYKYLKKYIFEIIKNMLNCIILYYNYAYYTK